MPQTDIEHELRDTIPATFTLPDDDDPRPPTASTVRAQPFDDAWQAWLWEMNALAPKMANRPSKKAGSEVRRPCKPGEIEFALEALYRSGCIGIAHMRVMYVLGTRRHMPQTGRRESYPGLFLWAEALDRLRPTLVSLGIVRSRS